MQQTSITKARRAQDGTNPSTDDHDQHQEITLNAEYLEVLPEYLEVLPENELIQMKENVAYRKVVPNCPQQLQDEEYSYIDCNTDVLRIERD